MKTIREYMMEGAEVARTATALLQKIDTMTSDAFSIGAEQPQREAVRTALAVYYANDHQAALLAREQEADDERYGRAVEARRDDFDNEREPEETR